MTEAANPTIAEREAVLIGLQRAAALKRQEAERLESSLAADARALRENPHWSQKGEAR